MKYYVSKPIVYAVFFILLMTSLYQVVYTQKKEKPKPQKRYSELTTKIDSLLSDPALSSCFLGLRIISLDNGTVLYSKNSNKLFHPASNMKLVTTAAAINALRPEFTFRTVLSSTAKIDNGVVRGDIFIETMADPMFKTEHIDSLVVQLVKKGVKSIKGNIIADTSLFDGLYWGAGWMWDDEPEAYEAFISPLTVNANSILFKFKGGKKQGDAVTFEMVPKVNFYNVVNEAITSSDTSIPKAKVTRPIRTNSFTITGRVAPADTNQSYEVSVWQPEWYYLNLFKSRLETNGITFNGKCKIERFKKGIPLAECSHPLDSVLTLINKPSDNLAAEIMLKTIGREKYGKPGSAEKGLKVVANYLLNCGVDTSQVELADGSGLSFYNELSPDAFVKILKHQYKQKSFSRFYESLPIAGVDGTLKNRMKGTKAERNVHAKTGTISGASTLSGYVTSADSVMIAFSFLSNHFTGEIRHLRIKQDRILELLAGMKLKE